MNTLGATSPGLRLAADAAGSRASGLEAMDEPGAHFVAVLGALKSAGTPEDAPSLDPERPAGRRAGDKAEDQLPDARSETANTLDLLAAVSAALPPGAGPARVPVRDSLETLVARALPNPAPVRGRAAPFTGFAAPVPDPSGPAAATDFPLATPRADATALADPTGPADPAMPVLIAGEDEAVVPAGASPPASEARTRATILRRETHFAPVLPRILAAPKAEVSPSASAPTGAAVASAAPASGAVLPLGAAPVPGHSEEAEEVRPLIPEARRSRAGDAAAVPSPPGPARAASASAMVGSAMAPLMPDAPRSAAPRPGMNAPAAPQPLGAPPMRSDRTVPSEMTADMPAPASAEGGQVAIASPAPPIPAPAPDASARLVQPPGAAANLEGVPDQPATPAPQAARAATAPPADASARLIGPSDPLSDATVVPAPVNLASPGEPAATRLAAPSPDRAPSLDRAQSPGRAPAPTLAQALPAGEPAPGAPSPTPEATDAPDGSAGAMPDVAIRPVPVAAPETAPERPIPAPVPDASARRVQPARAADNVEGVPDQPVTPAPQAARAATAPPADASARLIGPSDPPSDAAVVPAPVNLASPGEPVAARMAAPRRDGAPTPTPPQTVATGETVPSAPSSPQGQAVTPVADAPVAMRGPATSRDRAVPVSEPERASGEPTLAGTRPADLHPQTVPLQAQPSARAVIAPSIPVEAVAVPSDGVPAAVEASGLEAGPPGEPQRLSGPAIPNGSAAPATGEVRADEGSAPARPAVTAEANATARPVATWGIPGAVTGPDLGARVQPDPAGQAGVARPFPLPVEALPVESADGPAPVAIRGARPPEAIRESGSATPPTPSAAAMPARRITETAAMPQGAGSDPGASNPAVPSLAAEAPASAEANAPAPAAAGPASGPMPLRADPQPPRSGPEPSVNPAVRDRMLPSGAERTMPVPTPVARDAEAGAGAALANGTGGSEPASPGPAPMGPADVAMQGTPSPGLSLSGAPPQALSGPPAQQVAAAILGQIPRAPSGGVPGAPGIEGPLRLLTLQLHPADLGIVLVRMRLRDGQLEMSLHASREETATLLREGGEVLADLLRQGGYQPERVTVVSGPPPGGAAEGQPFAAPSEAGANPDHATPDQPDRRQPDGRPAAPDTSERNHESVSSSPDRSGVYL